MSDRGSARAFAPSATAPQAQAQPSARGGRKPDAYYRIAVGAALLHLKDRAALEFNALAQLPGVGRLADERYPGKIWRRGLCLRDLLTEAVDQTLDAADGEDLEAMRSILNRATDGDTLTAIARDLGLRRESLSRGLWSQVTALLWERLKPQLVALERGEA